MRIWFTFLIFGKVDKFIMSMSKTTNTYNRQNWEDSVSKLKTHASIWGTHLVDIFTYAIVVVLVIECGVLA